MSYAVLCLQTAWLKAHYPLYFFKALFNLNKDKAGMINKYILDAKLFNINILPPHINKSDINFSIYNNSILFGLSAITGFGESAANNLINERNKNGKYTGLENLKERLNPNKTQIISLIKSGAIPTKNKKQTLIKYLKSLYEPLTFRPVAKAPSYIELETKWDFDLEKYRTGTKKYDYDKERILTDYNKKKKEIFDKHQEERFQKYIDENKKYLENEEFWEFEALQIFINDNPFEQAYTYMSKQFEDMYSHLTSLTKNYSSHNHGIQKMLMEVYLESYGGLLFIGIFLSIMFMMAAILIIYYKQLTEGYEDQKRFEILQNVGMSQKEVKQTIRSQVLIFFFLPLVVAIIHTLFAYPLMTNVLNAFLLGKANTYIFCISGCMIGLILIYSIVYLLTAKIYYQIVKH